MQQLLDERQMVLTNLVYTCAGGQRCTLQLAEHSVKVQTVPEPHIYTFDAVAGEQSTQQQIFQGAGYIAHAAVSSKSPCRQAAVHDAALMF